MAPKMKADGGERSNRIRFVMLDADLTDNNVNVLAQAIVSALRGEGQSSERRLSAHGLANPRLPASPAPTSNGTTERPEQGTLSLPADENPPSADDEPEGVANGSASARPRKPSKPTQPKFFNELFPSTTESDEFKRFVEQHPTTKHSERYLLTALYLRDHGHDAVNMDKIYTAYRLAQWPMDLRDWDVNLRNQLRNDRFRRTDGGYAITTAGENIVRELRTAG